MPCKERGILLQDTPGTYKGLKSASKRISFKTMEGGEVEEEGGRCS
jgi:hypothetical protein